MAETLQVWTVQESAIADAMTREEAEAWLIRVGSAANELRVLLFEGYERQAWKALGYSTWTDCIQSLAERYSFSERHIWRLHAANETEKLLTNWSVGEQPSIPESQLRPLTQLPDDIKPIAWQYVVDTAPVSGITAAHVQSVVDTFKQPVTHYTVVDEWGHEETITVGAEEEIRVTKPHVAHNSGNNEWYTPAEYIEAARTVMGGVDLDPASSDIANRTVGASLYYTAEDDGLSFDWAGRVWMNPPYAGELIGKFCDKLAAHFIAGDVCEAIVLVNNATETQWFQTLLDSASAVCFIRRRVRFVDTEGNPSGAPLQGQAILYMGGQASAFGNVFGEFGAVLYA